MNTLKFKYSEKDIIDFCNECYESVEVFTFAEDLEYGFEELIEYIIAKIKD